jgi:basic amino acid/polyamine antiporter, APA family
LRTESSQNAPQKQLTLLDSTSLIIGIIVGVGIYQVAPDVAKGAGSWQWVLLIWAAGGLISLCGALGYAELASAYPKEGGDYVYLSRAYGDWAGFLFGWLQLAVVRPGDIVVMAFAFATYAQAIYDPLADTELRQGQAVYAAAAVVVLTAINILGVRQGKWVQNLLTGVKVLGLLAVVGVALAVPRGFGTAPETEAIPMSVALILVLFSFGGWNEMAYVAAEVKNPKRNIVRALVLGTTAVTLLYLLVNAAFLYTLGFAGVAASNAVAADAVSVAFPEIGGHLISALICVSALGALNGLVFTGARISYAVGADHTVFRYFGRWSRTTGTPARSLALQGALALVLILFLEDFVESVLYTAPTVYMFYMATSAAVLVLRRRDADMERPYRVSGYPFPTLLFIGVCGFLIYNAVTYAVYVKEAPWIVFVPLAVILAGFPLYLISRSSIAK